MLCYICILYEVYVYEVRYLFAANAEGGGGGDATAITQRWVRWFMGKCEVSCLIDAKDKRIRSRLRHHRTTDITIVSRTLQRKTKVLLQYIKPDSGTRTVFVCDVPCTRYRDSIQYCTVYGHNVGRLYN